MSKVFFFPFRVGDGLPLAASIPEDAEVRVYLLQVLQYCISFLLGTLITVL